MVEEKNRLASYGATEAHFAAADTADGLVLARVISQYRDLYRIVTEKDDGLAEVSGRLRHQSANPAAFPAVGDFVLVDRMQIDAGNAIIQEVLPRRSVFERSAVGGTGQSQIVAANIDLVFICMSLNNDFNLNRLERYLSLAWTSGARPVIVLTKADLCDDVDTLLAEIETVAFGVDVLVTSSADEGSCLQLLPYVGVGLTASFIGSSGVGKSTLINCLLGREALATSAIREDDDKGRHTTTRRDLMLLPQGGAVIDTPGMREIGVEPADLSKSFSDIAELASQCRFNDCSHTNEPGCAVQEAKLAGKLDERRFDNYMKLAKEARYEGLNSRQIEEEKINSMVGGFNEMKQIRNYVKQKNKRRQ